MAADFDPYHVWLSIPPEEQPANYYRLLSLRLFEANADVIDSAADRQTAHLRTFQGGKHGGVAQRLLNEVAAARVCLLDPKKRAAYDQQLRAKKPATEGISASGDSAVRRQPAGPTGLASPPAPSTVAPVARAASIPVPPQNAEVWDDLLGALKDKSPARAVQTSAKLAAARRKTANRGIAYGVAAAVAFVAVIGGGLIFINRSAASSDGTLVFNLPSESRDGATVTVDDTTVSPPANGRWAYPCPPGLHHLVFQRPGHKFSADVIVVSGQEQEISPQWKPKAVLVLNWPPKLRSGAILKIDGRLQAVTQRMPLEIAVEPGQHLIEITRPGSAAISTTATVPPDGRELVAITPPLTAPPAMATVVFDWPAKERAGAELTVDGHGESLDGAPGASSLEVLVAPGRHVVRIRRPGFESFSESVELAAGARQAIEPVWTPVPNAPIAAEISSRTTPATTPAATITPAAEIAPQLAKKLSPPAAAEQKRIAKQLDDLYKTSRSGPNDPALAQQLYDVAAKDDSALAERYVLLMKGAEIAALAGDLDLSLSGIDTLDSDYEIDALTIKQKLFDKFVGAAKSDQVEAAIPMAEELIDQALAADQYETALLLTEAASRAATKAKIATRKEIEDRVARRRRDVRQMEPKCAAAKAAQKTLETNPADADANSVAGRWLCLYKNDWSAGLPLLAKGSDGKTKSIAAAELKAPADIDGQIQLADDWWELAQKEAGVARDSLRLHAGEIYKAALPNLKPTLRKTAIEKRLAEISDVRPILAMAAADNPPGAIKFPLGRWVNVLRLVDTTKNAVEGNWSRTGNEVDVAQGRLSRIAIPVAVDGSYDLEVEFNRLQGNGEVRVRIPVGRHACDVEWSRENRDSGLEMLDGRHIIDGKNPTKVSSPDLQNGHVYRLLIMVRLRGPDRATIDVLLDGKPFLPHWEGNPSALAADRQWIMPTQDHLGLGAFASKVAFGVVRLRMVTGHASAAVAPSALPNGSDAQAPLRFTKWIYPADESGKPGYFEQRGAEWIEAKAGNVMAHFKESARTAEYVELFDQGRGLWVRLKPTEYSFSRDQTKWFVIAKGTPAAD